MEKRTSYNFDNHTHTVELFKSDKGNEIRVDHLRIKDKKAGYIKFVNDKSGLSVFGDFGNWVFNRPFYPSENGHVSDGYWIDKLKLYSSQESDKYDSGATAKALKEFIVDLDDYDYSEDDLKNAKQWINDLLRYVDDEIAYTYEAFRGENPTNIDIENIPFETKRSEHLEIIFDAFDELCKRMKNEKV